MTLKEREFTPESGSVDTYVNRKVSIFQESLVLVMQAFVDLTLVLVRYSIYRSIAILVNVRYRYLVVSRYFDISNESMISQTILGRYTSIEYRMKYRVSCDTILDPLA